MPELANMIGGEEDEEFSGSGDDNSVDLSDESGDDMMPAELEGGRLFGQLDTKKIKTSLG